MRKLFFLFVALLATTSLWAERFQVGDLYYKITSSSAPYTVEVTYENSSRIPNSNNNIVTAAIPAAVTYNDMTYSVTSIGRSAFSNCESLTSVTIPNSVTSIIGNPFSSCSSLVSMVVESGNTKYDSRDDCNAIIETATNILIAGCQNTIIPNSVTSIGDYAFYDCSALTSITIPNSVTSIGDYAFWYCSSLTSITIPNSVTSIGDWAFINCSSLTSITIPNSVTSIGDYAFNRCASLTSITIPNSVTSIGNSVFYLCSSLTSMVVEEGNTTYDSRNNCNAIIETATNTLIAGCQKTIIPNSVTSIGDWAFNGCYSLTSITIPNSVTSIGDWAFNGCESLTSITIPNSVTSIGDWAFERCSSLTSITIPNSVTSIGEEAFRYCTFDTLTCLAMTPPALGEDVFYGCGNPTLFVPCAALSDYQLHEQWGQFTTIECISSEEAETEEVVIESGTTTVIITWPTEEGADTYTIVIKKDGEVVCTLTFNSEGQLISIAFAPGHNGNHPAQYAEQISNGYSFIVTGLDANTTYTYDVIAKDSEDNMIVSHTGEFTTLSNVATSLCNIQSPSSEIRKLLRNGQLIILRDGVEYNAMGQEL